MELLLIFPGEHITGALKNLSAECQSLTSPSKSHPSSAWSKHWAKNNVVHLRTESQQRARWDRDSGDPKGVSGEIAHPDLDVSVPSVARTNHHLKWTTLG